MEKNTKCIYFIEVEIEQKKRTFGIWTLFFQNKTLQIMVARGQNLMK